jgi:hypothetical protein
MSARKSGAIIGAITLYLISTLSAFATFRFTGDNSEVPAPIISTGNGLDIPDDAPRTETCPLNGTLFTKAERDIWEKRRPLILMVENSVDARPHSGIIRADVVYEAVAEGGVTRLMPVYLCDAARSDVVVAPIRSVRIYFIDWAAEYGETPLFGHVGGANCSAEKLPNGSFGPCKSDPRTQAIEYLAKIGWRHSKGNNLDQFAIGAPTYKRNEARLFAVLSKNIATEHSVEGRTNLLWQEGERRGWSNLDPKGVDWQTAFRPWKFKDDAAEKSRGQAASISHDFWSGYKQYDARWQYDPAANAYLRFTGGEPHLDLETGKQLQAKNVVVQLTKETGPVDELKHMLYATTGEGVAYIFQDGQAIEGTWEKKTATDRTRFYTKKGQEVEFNRGQIWISVVSNVTKVAF